MTDKPAIPEGLSESPFGLRYHVPEVRVLVEIIDLRRKSGELWGEMTVRCNLEGVRAQLDGNRLRQGNFNFSSVSTRKIWANALDDMTGEAFRKTGWQWANLMERICQSVLDHEREGTVRGGFITGERIAAGGRPWAAFPIVPHGEMATLFSRGGSGKTQLAYCLAFGMALGRSVIEGVRVDRPYRVAILDWETSKETADDIWGIISETTGIRVPEGIWYEPMDTPLERGLPKIATVLERSRANLVIVDSVEMALLSSSEGAGDPADSITRVYQSLRRLGTWGLMIDHVTGGDLRSRKVALKAYGSIFRMNLARHAIALHVGQRSGDTSEAYLVCVKSNLYRDRWAMPGTLLRSDDELSWSFGDADYGLYDRLLSSGDTTASDAPVGEGAYQGTMSAGDRFLRVLLDAGPAGLTIAGISEQARYKSTAYIRKVMNSYEGMGLVRAYDGPGPTREKLWTLTPDGVSAIGE